MPFGQFKPPPYLKNHLLTILWRIFGQFGKISFSGSELPFWSLLTPSLPKNCLSTFYWRIFCPNWPFFFSRSNHFSIIFLRIFRQNQPILFSGSKMPFSFQNLLLPVNSLDYIFEDFWLRGVLFSANLHGKFKSGALKFQLKLGN